MSLLKEESEPAEAGPRAHARATPVLEWLKHAGHSFDGLERVLDYWRWLGTRRALAIVILILTPLVKYVWLPRVASGAVATIAESHGLDLSVEGGWSADLFDLRATGRDIVLKTTGRYGRGELLKADSMTVDLSVWALFGSYSLIKEISFDEPTIYLERTLAGRWNWEDIADARGLRSTMTISNVRLDGLRIEWVENLPANSGGGLVQSNKATLHIDDVDLLVQDLVVPVDVRQAVSRFTLEGRTADGRISMKGNGNFFKWGRAASQTLSAGVLTVPASETTGELWEPAVSANVYLENVGTAALGQMVSRNSLVMTRGSMTGRIELVVNAHKISCKTDLMLIDVGYTANPYSPLFRQDPAAVQKELTALRINRRVLAGCEGDQNSDGWRPLNALQAGITREAMKDAPPILQRVATIDEQRVGGTVPDNELNTLTETITEDLARQAGQHLAGALGGQIGGAMARSLTGTPRAGAAKSTTAPESNALSRGVKSVGRGIKGLFTRKKKDGQP